MSTWMVVEDEPDIYDVLLAMFEIWGIEGVAFVDGAEASDWIAEVDQGTITGDLPELAILDIRLPEISGPEVGARLRKSPKLGRIAIVMITAYRLSPEDEEAVKAKAQADALMYKPLPPMPELRRTLDEIISKRKNAPSSIPPLPGPTIPASVPAAPVAQPAPVNSQPKPAAQPQQAATPPTPATPPPSQPPPKLPPMSPASGPKPTKPN